MAADTYSATLGVILMGTGNDNNSWGSNANTLAFQILEDAIANALSSAVTGGTLDLSGSPPPAAASQVRYAGLIFTGTLTSNQIVQVPNLTKWWYVSNQTSGAFTLKFKTSSGSASTAIPQNSGWQVVMCDGANGIVVYPHNSKQSQMPDGSASAPAYSNINETNSGLYRNGTQDWRISVNGVDLFQVTGSGAGTPNVVNAISPATLQQQGNAVAGISGAITAGHLAKWASSTALSDAGVAGSLANINSVTAQYLDTSAQGMNAPLNLSLSATVVSSVLTVTVTGANGSNPSATNPVQVNFADSTLASGDPVNVSITSALSLATVFSGGVGGNFGANPGGGITGGQFRLWIVMFNDAGTARLAFINCVGPPASNAMTLFTLNEGDQASSTAMTNASNTAGVFYTAAGITVTSKCYRIIGYLTYETALPTPGSYTAVPDVLRLFGPGMRKPGDVIQKKFKKTTGALSITMHSVANVIQVIAVAVGDAASGSGTVSMTGQAWNTPGFVHELIANAGGTGLTITTFEIPTGFPFLDYPQTTSSISYVVSAPNGAEETSILIDEIMG